MRLTDLSIKHLKAPPRGAIVYTDDTLTGFGVRVSEGGTRSFVLTHGIQRHRETVGRVGVVTLQEARLEAKRRLAEYTLGKTKTPQVAWSAAKTEYLTTVKAKCSARAHAEYTWYLDAHFRFGERKLADIAPRDLYAKLDKLSDRPASRFNAFAILRAFMNWCYRRYYIETNPVGRMDAPAKPLSRERTLSDAELIAVWGATEKLTSFDVIVRLLILTGQRKSEISGLTDKMIGKNAITLPGRLAKNARTHCYPVGPMTLTLLPKNNGYLFPARDSNERPFSGWSICKDRLDARSGVSEWTLHDLRRTFRTKWAALGVSREVAEKYINHVSGVHAGINAIYDRHTYLAEMRTAVAIWEADLAHLLKD